MGTKPALAWLCRFQIAAKRSSNGGSWRCLLASSNVSCMLFLLVVILSDSNSQLIREAYISPERSAYHSSPYLSFSTSKLLIYRCMNYDQYDETTPIAEGHNCLGIEFWHGRTRESTIDSVRAHGTRKFTLCMVGFRWNHRRRRKQFLSDLAI